MNIWNYLLYPAIVTGVLMLYNNRKRISEYINLPGNRLLLLSVCLLMPVYILFTFATNKMAWYMAPFFGFIALLIVKFTIQLSAYHRRFILLWMGLFAFTFVRHVHYIATMPHASGVLSKAGYSDKSQNSSLNLPQDKYLYRLWQSNERPGAELTENVKTKRADIFLGSSKSEPIK